MSFLKGLKGNKSNYNNLLYIIIDSARYDGFMEARTPNMDQLGRTERRWSYSSWTFPSHHVFMMGMTPHVSPAHVFASEVYKKDFLKWVDRLNIPDVSFKKFVPFLSLPKFLQDYGYRTNALVSMPVLNQMTNLNKWFDTYELMENHNDFKGIIEKIEFSSEYPVFYMINIGEAHYPYRLQGEEELPILHGVHGVFKHLDDYVMQGDIPSEEKDERFFSDEQMEILRKKQIQCIEYIDELMETLFNKCPSGTSIIITSDHGELFGESGYFGHGPIFHEKVFEVPYLEGKI